MGEVGLILLERKILSYIEAENGIPEEKLQMIEKDVILLDDFSVTAISYSLIKKKKKKEIS